MVVLFRIYAILFSLFSSDAELFWLALSDAVGAVTDDVVEEAALVFLLSESDFGCAKRTPWYITELISRDTTRELSPDSPGR
jgi:hypothetical protein